MQQHVVTKGQHQQLRQGRAAGCTHRNELRAELLLCRNVTGTFLAYVHMHARQAL
jgi:hypothetical protein